VRNVCLKLPKGSRKFIGGKSSIGFGKLRIGNSQKGVESLLQYPQLLVKVLMYQETPKRE